MDNNLHKQAIKKFNSTIPIFILKELKYSKKPIYIRNDIKAKDLQAVIAKDFEGIEKDFISDQKIKDVYDGIIAIKWFQTEAVMFFKNTVDNSLVSDFFRPYQIKSLNLINQVNDEQSIIAMTFTR